MYLEVSHFDQLKALTENFTLVLQEYETNREELVSFHDTHLAPNGWRAFVLKMHGAFDEQNCQKAPHTTALLKKMKGLISAGFFSLEPGAEIPEHNDIAGRAIRAHMGMLIPEKSALVVAKERRVWSQREWLVFDPVSPHSAYNHGEQERIVMIVDLWPSEKRPLKLRLLNFIDRRRYFLSKRKWGRGLVRFVNRFAFIGRILRWLLKS